jgi:hypothetical protein
MPYKFKPHIRTAFCERDLVVLNLQTDTYQLVLDIDVAELNAALGALSSQAESPILDTLREIGAIRKIRSTYDQVVPIKFGRFFEQRWMTPIVETDHYDDRYHISSLIEVLRAGLTMKRMTLGRMAKILTGNSDFPNADPVNKQAKFERMSQLMQSLNAAFVWDFTGNKCLTYSYALVRLARRQGIPAKLMIGVRTRPFLSHAWVELHNQVVNDAPTLKENLAVIMEA